MAADDYSVKAGVRDRNHTRIQNLQEGDTVSGLVEVTLVTTHENFYAESTAVSLDGRFCKHTISHPGLNGGNRDEFFYLDTYLHSNGEHRLSVTDEAGGFDTRHLIFDNVISAVEICPSWDAEPPGEGEFPYFIKAVVMPPQAWQVEIKSLIGLLVRHFEGYGDRIDLRWDGKDELGRPTNIGDGFFSPFGVYMAAESDGIAVLVGFINDLSIR